MANNSDVKIIKTITGSLNGAPGLTHLNDLSSFGHSQIII